MNIKQYKEYLTLHGRNQAEVKKNQSDFNIDTTFTRDPNYKRVYILTRDGWQYEDAKYQFHVANSILKDSVDYYLQFRPKVHYPVGSYVIVPDDTSFDVNLTEEQLENPFSQPVSERTQWWFIVGRDQARSYVRYNILKCNWNFQWIWKGKIMSCFGAIRNANSYTSGVWHDEISESLDNITSAWVPDYYATYGIENLQKLGLDNNQTITYNQRFMITNSDYEPKCYRVTKVIELMPTGVIKYTLKQDEFNENRDEPKFKLCDYYTNEGNPLVVTSNNKADINPDVNPDINPENILPKTSTIVWKDVNENGELIDNESVKKSLTLGKPSYFSAVFSTGDTVEKNIDAKWSIKVTTEGLSNDEINYYNNLITISKFGLNIVSLKPGKARSLIGKTFDLIVSDVNGDYLSSISLEVTE